MDVADFSVVTPDTPPLPMVAVLNEIHYAPADKTSREEFVELLSVSDGSVDLSGWRITGGIEFTFPNGTTLAPGGYVVVAEDPAVMATRFGYAKALGPFSGGLRSTGDSLILRDPDGHRRDEVSYGRGFPWPTGGGEGGYSIEKISPLLDGKHGGSWRLSAPMGAVTTLVPTAATWRYLKGTKEASSPTTAWRATSFDDSTWLSGQTPIGYGETFLNTVLSDMSSSYSSVFLRIAFNVTDPKALGRLRLEAQIDDGMVIWLNGTNVGRFNMASTSPAFNALAQSAVESQDFLPFDLGEASVLLVPGKNVLAIQFHNQSLAGSNDAFVEARLLATATDRGPTPGAKNARYEANTPPLIDSVNHRPISPRTAEPITITARISDSDGISAVKLEYQLVDPGVYVRLTDPKYAQDWTAVPMKDDGTGGDAVAADGVYSALLDASLSKHRRLIRYRITATDGKSVAIRVPYADDPQPNFALFVYDGVPAWRGASQPGVTPVIDFGSDVMTRLPVYHLIALESDVLKSQYDSAYESGHFYATMVEGGIVYDHIEFENRGEFSTYISGKNKWRFHFGRGHEFQARNDFGQPYKSRWRTMNLSACATPWVPPNRGMACLDESVAFRLYALAGTLAPHMNYLHFRVIDESEEQSLTDQYRGDLWGLYGTIEQTDGAFLDERNLPDGNLYKVESGQGDKRNQGPFPPLDSSDYDTFRNGFNASQPIAWWRSNLDLPAYYAFRSTDRIVNNMDIRDGWNHCIYLHPQTKRWTPMPWDLDMLYMPVTHWSGVINLQNSIMQHPELMMEYRNRARELSDLLYTNEELGALVEEQALFAGSPSLPGMLSFAQLDQAMWNYHPRTASAHKGAFYRNPASASFRGGVVNRTLVSADHAGMARYLKDFTLTGYGANQLATESADPDIPARPTMMYVGSSGYPLDGIRFQTSAFSDPQGAATFAALRWRVAEVTPASVAPDLRNPRRYEIEAAWESPLITTWNDTITIPPEVLRVGGVHRARVRMMDNTGRWSRWSAPIEFTVGGASQPPVQTQSLRVTELHFHPLGELAEEFIEITNIGSTTVDLSNVAITDGVSFRFADAAIKQIAPGQRIVVVENIDDFRARYGKTGIAIAGQYKDKLSNGGERVILTYGKNIPILDFTYDDKWHPMADGQGRSLEIIAPNGMVDKWSSSSGWRASTGRGGTPGN